MRFYVLSDLHLRNDNLVYAKKVIKELCESIKQLSVFDEEIVFFILGDIADKGDKKSFDLAKICFSLIREELRSYNVIFEFVPGNHDLIDGNLIAFDEFTSTQGNYHSFDKDPAYSREYENVNFIFADSNLSRKFNEPGRIDIQAIKQKYKNGKNNVVLFHHGLILDRGDDAHNVVENANEIIQQLKNMPISFFFHGHKHYLTSHTKTDLVNIGCGSFCEDVSWRNCTFNQFIVGYIDGGTIGKIQRWVYTEEGENHFLYQDVYPSEKKFDDPNKVNKIVYSKVDNYIGRTVSLYEDSKKEGIEKYFDRKSQKKLAKVLQEDCKKVFLLADAGMGKSVESRNLAFELCKQCHTFLYQLEYYGGEKIEELFPEQYKNLMRQCMVLIFDGYDEMDEAQQRIFEKRLNEFSNNEPEVRMVITSRKNYRQQIKDNKLKLFSDFSVYVLDALEEQNIRNYLASKNIDVNHFLKCAQSKNVYPLVYNPFYFMYLYDIYKDTHKLPNKNDLMKSICDKAFDLDDEKYNGTLDDRYDELNALLEKLAISMQLMHQLRISNRDEFQKLFNIEDRTLIMKSGLLEKDDGYWRFTHNNFREYYAAKYLSKQNKEFVVKTIACESGIKPHWVNVLGSLTGFELDWDLKSWLIEKEPAALVKYSSDQLDSNTRTKIFELIFDKYEKYQIHFNEALCNEQEIAEFADNISVLLFLIDRIENPRNWVSQFTALNILRHYTKFFGMESKVQNVLLNCCKDYENTNKLVCRLAINAIGILSLEKRENAKRLMEIFGNVDVDYIRLGMYEYLQQTNLIDDYVDYILSGIKLVSKDIDNDRIGNETYTLCSCLQNLASKKSIFKTLDFFLNEDFLLYSEGKILNACIETLSELYKKGDIDIFDTVLEIYLDAKKKYNSELSNAFAYFFDLTNTKGKALLIASESSEDGLYFLSNLVDSETIKYFADNYGSQSTKSKSIFHEIVVRYVRDENKYNRYSKLIADTDGEVLPEFVPEINYVQRRISKDEEFLTILLDRDKLNTLYTELLEKTRDLNITTRQLKKNLFKEKDNLFKRLSIKMYNYSPNAKVYNFFEGIDYDDFVLYSLNHLLYKEIYDAMTFNNKNDLLGLAKRMINRGIFDDCVDYVDDGYYINPEISYILSIVINLDYEMDEKDLLYLIEIPSTVFAGSNKKNKCDYLCSKLGKDKIMDRIMQNVKSKSVQSTMLIEYFSFFDDNRDSRLCEEALKICKDTNDITLRRTTWQYLYNCYGSEYIECMILPFADENLLLEINFKCKNISKGKMCEAMEREYIKEYSLRLQADLIKSGSTKALNDYVQKVSRDKRPVEDKFNRFDGPTEAIASIKNPEFLPQLKILLETVLDKAYIDNEYVNLKGSLTQALINCGGCAYQETTRIIKELQPSIEEDEDNFVYCNYILNGIETERKRVIDKVYHFKAVKKLLNENASI